VRVEDPPGSGSFQSYPAQLADGTFLVAEVPLPTVGANRVDVVCSAAAGGESVETFELIRLGSSIRWMSWAPNRTSSSRPFR
jgi:hypothetical protein